MWLAAYSQAQFPSVRGKGDPRSPGDAKRSLFLERQIKPWGSLAVFTRPWSVVCCSCSWQLCHLGFFWVLACRSFLSLTPAVAPDEPERGHGPAVHQEHQRQFPLRGLRGTEWVQRLTAALTYSPWPGPGEHPALASLVSHSLCCLHISASLRSLLNQSYLIFIYAQYLPHHVHPNFFPPLFPIECQHFCTSLQRKGKKFAVWHQSFPFPSCFAWWGHMCHGNIFKEIELDCSFFGLVFLGLFVRRNQSHCSLYLDTRKLILDFFFLPLCVSFPLFFYFLKHIRSVQKSVLRNTLSCASPH